MNFDFSSDQKALRDQARKFLAEHASSVRVRRILDTDEPYDRDLWRGVAEMGSRVAADTDEILKNIIAERVLGLPQDIRMDREAPFDELPASRR